MTMKKLLLGALALGAYASVGAAGAADLAPAPAYKAPMAPMPVAYNWTGCYLGGGGGYGMWNQESFVETFPGLVPTTTNVTSGGRGWFGTVQGGCDYQLPTTMLGYGIVLGAFADGDWGSIKGNYSPPAFTIGGAETESSAWAVGARLGAVITPKFMAFVSGGYTQANFDQINMASTTIPPGAGAFFIPSHTYTGWFIGTGYEYGLDWWPGLFWKTEYRFAEYSATDLGIFTVGPPVAVTASGINSEKFIQTIRSELIWRFNWGGPSVVARY